MPRTHTLRVQTRVVHGHRRAFVMTGKGPALLLLHGLGCDHTTWSPVIERLSRRFTVIAPDLLGHGASDKPRADYTLGGYANGMRDLLALLGIDRVTVVGHSFGGGIAMQFAYQFPQYTERLMLVAPGGFGRRRQPVAPRSDTARARAPVLAVAASPPVLAAARFVGERAHAAHLPGSADVLGALVGPRREARRRRAGRVPARPAGRGGLAWSGGDDDGPRLSGPEHADLRDVGGQRHRPPGRARSRSPAGLSPASGSRSSTAPGISRTRSSPIGLSRS